MNKWIKYGVTSLALGAAALTASANPEATVQNESEAIEVSALSVDVRAEMGGSKLKDRMITTTDEDIAVVYAILKA